jgi:hypothetical protein
MTPEEQNKALLMSIEDRLKSVEHEIKSGFGDVDFLFWCIRWILYVILFLLTILTIFIGPLILKALGFEPWFDITKVL